MIKYRISTSKDLTVRTFDHENDISYSYDLVLMTKTQNSVRSGTRYILRSFAFDTIEQAVKYHNNGLFHANQISLEDIIRKMTIIDLSS